MDNKTEQNVKNEVENDVITQYEDQTKGDENVHFEHVDWTYSDSSCCC